eukprot:m.493380 g.493380  ORF g.493380 m.493380 type:complete len:266 (-) comp57284_c0_seq8:156-953(-)
MPSTVEPSMHKKFLPWATFQLNPLKQLKETCCPLNLIRLSLNHMHQRHRASAAETCSPSSVPSKHSNKTQRKLRRQLTAKKKGERKEEHSTSPGLTNMFFHHISPLSILHRPVQKLLRLQSNPRQRPILPRLPILNFSRLPGPHLFLLVQFMENEVMVAARESRLPKRRASLVSTKVVNEFKEPIRSTLASLDNLPAIKTVSKSASVTDARSRKAPSTETPVSAPIISTPTVPSTPSSSAVSGNTTTSSRLPVPGFASRIARLRK